MLAFAFILAAPLLTFGDSVAVYSVEACSVPISADTVFGMSGEHNADDRIAIRLMTRRQKLGKFRVKTPMRDIYQAALEAEPAGYFSGEVAEFLVRDSKNRWYYVWHEVDPRMAGIMIFPAVQIADEPALFSATGSGQSSQDKQLGRILQPYRKRGKSRLKIIRERNTPK